MPAAPVSIAVALADKLDQLVGFFAIGEKPTGSGDPYALRRAALGVIRIIRENGLRLHAVAAAGRGCAGAGAAPTTANHPDDLADRRHSGLPGRAAARAASRRGRAARCAGRRVRRRAHGTDDDLIRLLARTEAVAALLGTEDGANLLVAYRRAANILRIEERKDGPHDGAAGRQPAGASRRRSSWIDALEAIDSR